MTYSLLENVYDLVRKLASAEHFFYRRAVFPQKLC